VIDQIPPWLVLALWVVGLSVNLCVMGGCAVYWYEHEPTKTPLPKLVGPHCFAVLASGLYVAVSAHEYVSWDTVMDAVRTGFRVWLTAFVVGNMFIAPWVRWVMSWACLGSMTLACLGTDVERWYHAGWSHAGERIAEIFLVYATTATTILALLVRRTMIRSRAKPEDASLRMPDEKPGGVVPPLCGILAGILAYCVVKWVTR
jgi:hypothetical protein